jgi:galactose mutarotase-like enzyme
MDEEPLTLVCGAARAEINVLGAELRAWRAQDLDLLWTPDPAVWPAVSPILFPIVGRLRGDRLRVGAIESSMGAHGFAASSRFTIKRQEPDAAFLVLRDSAASRAVYPFRFRLSVAYRLAESELWATLTIANAGEEPMPYACGFHPGFRWPFAGGLADGYRILFEAAESPLIPVITPDGLFGPGRRSVPLRVASLELARELFAREALCFLDAKSRALRFVAPNGRAIRMETFDLPHLALWSRPPASFLCLEAWTGHGDPADFHGDLFQKPSMRTLAAGGRAVHGARYRLE